jgi:hypothetical protein
MPMNWPGIFSGRGEKNIGKLSPLLEIGYWTGMDG